jgi:RHS repeat-associated protein
VASAGQGSATLTPQKTYLWRDDTLTGVVVHQPARQVAVILTDHLGSPIEVHDMSGALLWTWYADAFGTTLPDEDPESSGKRFTLNVRLPGQYYDAESGLHYNGQRYYAPTIGRYISSDPIGVEGGMNTFAYVGGNPVSYYDPNGLFGMADMPLFPQGAVDFSAGFGDAVSLGLTNLARDHMGTNDAVNKCSGYYTAGEVAGVAVDAVIGGAAGWEAAGAKGAGKEFSHWIPNRMGGPRSKWNGNFVSTAEHALSDPYRYRFMPKVWKAENPMPNMVQQQWVRVPNVYRGATAGGAFGAASAAISGDCTCQ